MRTMGPARPIIQASPFAIEVAQAVEPRASSEGGELLTPRQQIALRLSHTRVDGRPLKQREIAQIMGISRAAASELLRRARERIDQLRRLCKDGLLPPELIDVVTRLEVSGAGQAAPGGE